MSIRKNLSRRTDAELSDALKETWKQRKALEIAAKDISEELVSRIFLEEYPNAHRVILAEDRSHGLPHGHFHELRDRDGLVLLSAKNPEWSQKSYYDTINDLSYCIHVMGANSFLVSEEYPSDLLVYTFLTKPLLEDLLFETIREDLENA